MGSTEEMKAQLLIALLLLVGAQALIKAPKLKAAARFVNNIVKAGDKSHNDPLAPGNRQPGYCYNSLSNSAKTQSISTKELSDLNAKQVSHQLNFMARQYNDLFEKLLHEFQEKLAPESEVHTAPMKAEPRILEKINGKYNAKNKRYCQELTDIVRGSLYFKKATDAFNFLTALKEKKYETLTLPAGIKKIEVANVKNRYAEPKDEASVHYRDALVNLKMYKTLDGSDYHIAELQVHMTDMVKAKSDKALGGHLMYRVRRQQEEKVANALVETRFLDTKQEQTDWNKLQPILNGTADGKATQSEIEQFVPRAEWEKIAREQDMSPARAQVELARINSRKVYDAAWKKIVAADPNGAKKLQSLDCKSMSVKGVGVKNIAQCSGVTGGRDECCCTTDTSNMPESAYKVGSGNGKCLYMPPILAGTTRGLCVPAKTWQAHEEAAQDCKTQDNKKVCTYKPRPLDKVAGGCKEVKCR